MKTKLTFIQNSYKTYFEKKNYKSANKFQTTSWEGRKELYGEIQIYHIPSNKNRACKTKVECFYLYEEEEMQRWAYICMRLHERIIHEP